MRQEQRFAELLIGIACAMEAWESLWLAIDFLIEQQRQFVAGWTETVRSRGHQPNSPVRGVLGLAEAEARTGIKHQQVSRWRGLLAPDQIDRYRQRLEAKAKEEAGLLPAKSHRTLGTGDNEWFTPPQYIDAAKKVFGGEIDLDPATHEKAQKRINAKEYYTLEKNGLKQQWSGRVWLNPPYGRIQVAEFTTKLINHYQCGDVSAAILLTHNYTDTRWFHAAAAACDLICFTSGRVAFEDITGETCVPAQGQAFCYFGAGADGQLLFAETFGAIGFVVAKPIFVGVP